MFQIEELLPIVEKVVNLGISVLKKIGLANKPKLPLVVDHSKAFLFILWLERQSFFFLIY